MYAKVIKWISWVLLILGAVIGVYGFIVGFDDNSNAPVDYVLYWAYAMVAVALIAVLLGVVVINTMNDPKNLLRLGIGILAIVVVVGAAYLLAPGTPAVGYLGGPVSDATLKLTDTILNLTYLCCGGAILSILVGGVITATRK